MKFLCVTCDEAMKLSKAQGPDAGSLTAVFACEGCGWEMAMLTNPSETQVIGAMGVQVGGRSAPAGPMEMLRSSLEGHKEIKGDQAASGEEASGCPFAAMFQGDGKASETTS